MVDLPLRRPWLVIAVFALATLAALPGLLRLELRTDGHALVPAVDPKDVVSLATEHRHRVYPGTLDFRPFLDPQPDTPELLQLLDDDLRVARILDGTLISADRKAVTVLVGVPPLDPAHPYDRV